MVENLESDQAVNLDDDVFFNRTWLVLAKQEIYKFYGDKDSMSVSEIEDAAMKSPKLMEALLQS